MAAVAELGSLAGRTMKTSAPRVFLCHSSADKPTVRAIYDMLHDEGYAPWFDEVSLVGGQDWRLAIEQAIGRSDFFLACLSESAMDRRGFFHKEIRLALEVLDEMPEDSVYFVPIRLEPCRVPNRLRSTHWIDYYKPDFRNQLLRALSSDGAPIAQMRSIPDRMTRHHGTESAAFERRHPDNFLEVRIEIDYTRLIDLLHRREWAAAAYETLSLCVLASGRRPRPLRLPYDLFSFDGMTTSDYIPSIHLRKLADLWRRSARECLLPIARRIEAECELGEQIELVNARCKVCGLPSLMRDCRHEDLEKQ